MSWREAATEMAPRLQPNSFARTGRNTPKPLWAFHVPNITRAHAATTIHAGFRFRGARLVTTGHHTFGGRPINARHASIRPVKTQARADPPTHNCPSA